MKRIMIKKVKDGYYSVLGIDYEYLGLIKDNIVENGRQTLKCLFIDNEGVEEICNLISNCIASACETNYGFYPKFIRFRWNKYSEGEEFRDVEMYYCFEEGEKVEVP